MKLTKIVNNTDGTTTRKEYEYDSKDYEIQSRLWLTSDGEAIREWTPHEYVFCNPNEKKLIDYKIDNRTIKVEAHCLEHRITYARSHGVRLIGYSELIEYPLLEKGDSDNAT